MRMVVELIVVAVTLCGDSVGAGRLKPSKQNIYRN